MKNPKIIILTSNQLRHKYFCNELSKKLDIAGIVAETKSASITDFSNFSPEDQVIMKTNFSERDAAEKLILGEELPFPVKNVLDVAFGEVNAQSTFEWVKAQKPDIILLYGSSIIKDPLLSYFENKIINFHLGLSPYYKGSGTNFWPLVNKEPECVGVTIHLAISKVDAGSILHQVRPDMTAVDNAQIIGSKAIKKGVEALPSVVKAYYNNIVHALPQDIKSGKIFRNKDFSAAAVKQLSDNLADGMISTFINNYESRCAAYPIVAPKSESEISQAENN